MSKDFAKKTRPRAATRTKPQSKVPGWVWLFTGTALGAFIMFLMRLSELPASEDSAADTTTKVPSESSDDQQPRFDFYKLLKESEVPVPVYEPEESAETAPEQLSQYLLQVASFKAAEDAEQLRAELILLNLTAHVETAKVRNGETWHRVIVGPFESRSKLAKARSILVSNKFEALILKRAIES